MMTFKKGNLLTAESEALVNTVNEVGVMGKGIALMFREAFPENNRLYEQACKNGEVRVGHVFITENLREWGPRWIVNFPTKKHWRNPSKIEWIHDGLEDLRKRVIELKIESIAIPPLGCGNGGLDWSEVRKLIVDALADLPHVDVQVFSPTVEYQNARKQAGIGKLTPARALIAEMVRRYEVLGFDCSLLEVQKLSWFLQRALVTTRTEDPIKVDFVAGRYGPYADSLRHVLNALDGSFLHSEKRIADSNRNDTVTFEYAREAELREYLARSSMQRYADCIAWTQRMIEGFESPYGMELLATVDWLLTKVGVSPTIEGLRSGIRDWPHSRSAGIRKSSLFDDRLLSIASERVLSASDFESSQRTLSL